MRQLEFRLCSARNEELQMMSVLESMFRETVGKFSDTISAKIISDNSSDKFFGSEKWTVENYYLSENRESRSISQGGGDREGEAAEMVLNTLHIVSRVYATVRYFGCKEGLRLLNSESQLLIQASASLNEASLNEAPLNEASLSKPHKSESSKPTVQLSQALQKLVSKLSHQSITGSASESERLRTLSNVLNTSGELKIAVYVEDAKVRNMLIQR